MTSAVTSVLGRLPSVQLFVLNAVVLHLERLIWTTSAFTDVSSMIKSSKTEEPDDIYIIKLALSVGRCELSPGFLANQSLKFSRCAATPI